MVLERSSRGLFLDVSVGVHILLVVEQSILESQSRGRCQGSDTYGIPTAEYNLNKNMYNQPRDRKIESTESSMLQHSDGSGRLECYFVPTVDDPQSRASHAWEPYC